MYNRYIPQSDGSYRRNTIPEQRQPAPQRQQHTPLPPAPPPCDPKPVQPRHMHHSTSPLAFLKNLLPKDFDTGDLLIVLLLLLMAGDCAEDQNTAILTLALYLFL